MHDGIPIWKHLMNNGQEQQTHIKGADYGSMAERIGKRELRNKIKFDHLLDKLFPDLPIISMNRISKKSHRSLEYGDYCLEISYLKESLTYGKKILIIEIKHGKVQISQQQIRRYSEYITNPSAYFRKADEVKIIFMLFTEINTSNATATYSLCEFNNELASRVLNALPKTEDIDLNSNIFSTFDDKIW